jgi:hypothetical protein
MTGLMASSFPKAPLSSSMSTACIMMRKNSQTRMYSIQITTPGKRHSLQNWHHPLTMKPGITTATVLAGGYVLVST